MLEIKLAGGYSRVGSVRGVGGQWKSIVVPAEEEEQEGEEEEEI